MDETASLTLLTFTMIIKNKNKKPSSYIHDRRMNKVSSKTIVNCWKHILVIIIYQLKIINKKIYILIGLDILPVKKDTTKEILTII